MNNYRILFVMTKPKKKKEKLDGSAPASYYSTERFAQSTGAAMNDTSRNRARKEEEETRSRSSDLQDAAMSGLPYTIGVE